MKQICFFSFSLFIFVSTTFSQVFIDQKPFKTIKKQEAEIISLTFSNDGKELASGSEDKTCVLWSFPEGKELRSYSGFLGGVRATIFTENKEFKYFFVAGDRTIKLYDGKNEQINKYSGTATYIWSLAYNKTLNQLVAGSYDKYARVIDCVSGKVVKSLEGHTKNVLAVDYSPNGQYIATGSLDETVKIWDAKTFNLLNTLTGHGGNIYDVAFTPDSKYVISASNDYSTRVWSLDSAKTIRNLTGHERGVSCLAVSPDGYYLLTGSYDASVKLWDILRGECIFTFYSHSDAINSLAYHPSGNYFASGSSDKTIIWWELKPEIFVANYFTKEYDAEISSNNELFAPKSKDESKDDFKNRLEKQDTFRKQLIDKLYQRYLSEIKGKEKL
jgi:WD40 repeat protein